MKIIFVTASVLLFSGFAQAGQDGLRPPFQLALGKKLFEENCARCHGQWANGSDKGPPLAHRFYLPDHHGDDAFYRAALSGVQAHHWNFGNMPPVAGITRRQLDRIVPYVRWLQKQQYQKGER